MAELIGPPIMIKVVDEFSTDGGTYSVLQTCVSKSGVLCHLNPLGAPAGWWRNSSVPSCPLPVLGLSRRSGPNVFVPPWRLPSGKPSRMRISSAAATKSVILGPDIVPACFYSSLLLPRHYTRSSHLPALAACHHCRAFVGIHRTLATVPD